MCEIILFPMARRVGRIREVAGKLLAKPTDRAAEHYRRVVGETALAQMRRGELTADLRDRQLAEFWKAVEAEMSRVRASRLDGDAA